MHYASQIPIGRIPSVDALRDLTPSLAEAAQKVYDAWDQVDGYDEELGTGGICQDIAAAMAESLCSNGFEHVMTLSAAVGENHVFVVALLDEGVFEIDFPPSVYETGGGYTWLKKEGVVFGAEHLVIQKLGEPISPEAFYERYVD